MSISFKSKSKIIDLGLSKAQESKIMSELINEWKSYIYAMAHRFSIDTSGDVDELYNYGLELLWEIYTQFPDDPVSVRKMFKTTVTHRFADHIDRFKCQARDVRKKVSMFSVSQNSDGESALYKLSSVISSKSVESGAEAFEIKDAINHFMNGLTSFQRRLLTLLLDPDDGLIEVWQRQIDMRGYKKVPKSIPNEILAEYMGVSLHEVKNGMSYLRNYYVNFYNRTKVDTNDVVPSRMRFVRESIDIETIISSWSTSCRVYNIPEMLSNVTFQYPYKQWILNCKIVGIIGGTLPILCTLEHSGELVRFDMSVVDNHILKSVN